MFPNKILIFLKLPYNPYILTEKGLFPYILKKIAKSMGFY